MKPVHIDLLEAIDIDELALTDDEFVVAVNGALGHALLEKAARLGIGQRLRFA